MIVIINDTSILVDLVKLKLLDTFFSLNFILLILYLMKFSRLKRNLCNFLLIRKNY